MRPSAPTAPLRPAHRHAPDRSTSDRRADRVLQALGVDRAYAEDVLGDLAEEYALRAARDGTGAARWWYAGEALRSAPHLARSALRTASLQSPARRSALVAGLALASLGLHAAWEARKGPAARLLPGADGAGARVVVSTRRPVRLPVRVLDAAGHALPTTGVRYAWESGAPAEISPDGTVRCATRGDAVVRAALGPLVTRVVLSCQPVRLLYAHPWYNFALGGPAQAMRVGGIGVDGEPVSRLAADVRIADPDVAAVERTVGGLRIRPLAPGRTQALVQAGGHQAVATVTVFEPVTTLDGLRDEQRYVLASVRLQPGRSVRWPLPAGGFWLVNQVDAEGNAPTLAVAGPVACSPTLGPGVYRTRCRARGRGASVTLAHPGTGGGAVLGVLALEREAAAR